MNWHYFISHASEDKALIAAPLAHYLQSASFNVWYDDFSLQLGDSILGGINRGLAESEFGVVILSPAFFAKAWPQRELAGLVATATSDVRRILPVWHHVNATSVARTAPVLADLKAVQTARGLHLVAEEIVRASYPDGIADLPVSNAGRERRQDLIQGQDTLRELLTRGARREDVFLLLSAYQTLLFNLTGYRPLLIPATRVDSPLPFDFAILTPHGVTGPQQLTLVLLGPTRDDGTLMPLIGSIDAACGEERQIRERPYNDYLPDRVSGEFDRVLDLARALQPLVDSGNVHHGMPHLWNFSFLLLYGRRTMESATARSNTAASARIRIEVASYDRLADHDVAAFV
jgi:TIR domain